MFKVSLAFATRAEFPRRDACTRPSNKEFHGGASKGFRIMRTFNPCQAVGAETPVVMGASASESSPHRC